MKLYNTKETILDDTKRGIALVAPHLKEVGHGVGYLNKKFNDQTIPVISGGGAGHEPSDFGFVGENLLTACVTGQLFTPPTADEIVAVTKEVTQQKKAFFIVKNFPEDVAAFEKAFEMLSNEGWQIASCLVADDISVDNKSLKKYRRGLAGTVLVEKIIGTLAQRGASLESLEKVGKELCKQIFTIGLAFSDSILTKSHAKDLTLGKDDIYYGVGIHGEAGYRKETWKPSELMAREIVNKMRLNFKKYKKEGVALLVNNLGKLSPMEELIFTADVSELLELEGLRVDFIKTGSFMTSHDMSGVSVSLLLLQEEWLDCLQAPSTAYSWPNNGEK